MEQHGRNLGGRPVIFDEAMRQDFLDALAMGKSNSAACKVVGISRPALHLHLARDADFRDAYRSAKALAVDALMDEAGELAEQALRATSGLEVARLKLVITFLQWQAARIAPRRWGKQAVAVIMPAVDPERETAKRLAFLEALRQGG